MSKFGCVDVPISNFRFAVTHLTTYFNDLFILFLHRLLTSVCVPPKFAT